MDISHEKRAIFSIFVRIRIVVMSYPIFRHHEPFIWAKAPYPLSKSLVKHVFLWFPTQKWGGVPNPAPKCTGWPRVCVGGGRGISILALYVFMAMLYFPPPSPPPTIGWVFNEK